MSLFHHNPPSATFLQSLFVGREWELEQLTEHVPGDWSEETIRTVHGDSRVGKSHLVLVFLDKLTKEQRFNFVTIRAAAGYTARRILTELYESIRNLLLDIKIPSELPEEVGSGGLLEEAKARIRIYDGLITGDEGPHEITYQKSFEDSLSFKILATLFGLSPELSGTAKESNSESRKHVYVVPNEYRIVAFIEELCDVLFNVSGKRTVIYIDDVDLLDAGPYINQKEVADLIRHLADLKRSSNVTVVASLRTRHMGVFYKELEEAVRVYPMSDDDIKEIYKRHIDAFHEKELLFADDCLDALVQANTGHIGNFLRWCSQFRSWAGRKKKLWQLAGDGSTQVADGKKVRRLLTKADLTDYVLDRVALLSSKADLDGHMQRIRAAAGAGQLTVELPAEVMGTELICDILEEPSVATPVSSEGTALATLKFGINPFVVRILKSAVQAVPAASQGPLAEYPSGTTPSGV